jgi:uncharacterized protein YjbI with pentapeptide repeats
MSAGATDAEDLKRRLSAGERDFDEVMLGDSDLSSIVVENASLRGSGFAGVQLQRAELKAVDWSRAMLTDCNGAEASFEDVRFDEARLIGMNFTRARFRHCSFLRTSLDDSDLSKAVFEDCRFDDTIVTHTRMEGARFDRVKGSWRACDAAGADLHAANLAGLDLDDVKAVGANFSQVDAVKLWCFECDLSAADFTGAKLQRASITSCALRGSKFRDADVSGADLGGQDLDGVDLAGAKYDAKTRFPKGFDPDAAGMVRLGPAKVPAARGKMTRAEFEKRWGKPELAQAPNDLLAQARVPLRVRADRRPVMLDGQCYNVGYFRPDASPAKLDYDWAKLSAALERAHELAAILADHYESSNQDVPYFPLVLAPPAGKERAYAEIDVREALGEHPAFTDSASELELSWLEEDIDSSNAFASADDTDGDSKKSLLEYFDAETLEAYERATRWMSEHLEEPVRLSVTGADKYPVFWLGRTPDGLYVGVFTLRDTSD